jgi:tetratricopeptide (TPR) repeat protein
MNPLLPAQLNNEGVFCVDAGEYDDAISNFSEALTVVKAFIARGRNRSAGTCQGVRKSSTHFSAEPYLVEGTARTHELAHAKSPIFWNRKDEELIPSDQSYVFEDLILIPEQLENPTYRSYAQLSFILVFNLALTNHLSAIENGMSRQRLTEALALYELASAIQVQEELQLSVLHTMAIVNNLSQIHKELDDREKAEECFDNLLSSAMFLVSTGESCEQLNGFLANVASF